MKVEYKNFDTPFDASEWLTKVDKYLNLNLYIIGITHSDKIITVYYKHDDLFEKYEKIF